MIFNSTSIAGVIVITPEPSNDSRGFFERRFCELEFSQIGVFESIKQINRSRTKIRGTIRGMHLQLPPMEEIKIVQCIRGAVFDVAVDLRKDSPTYLNWFGQVLTHENGLSVCIPRGCAHGVQTLEDDCDMLYLHDQFYSVQNERRILFSDPDIGIKWPLAPTEISMMDRQAHMVRELNSEIPILVGV